MLPYAYQSTKNTGTNITLLKCNKITSNACSLQQRQQALDSKTFKRPRADILDRGLANECRKLLPNRVEKLCLSEEPLKKTDTIFFVNKQGIHTEVSLCCLPYHWW